MKLPRPPLALAALLLALSLAGGCRRAEEPAAQAGDSASAMDGLSRDEIREQAEAMSPEQAEQMGIVDSTIHVEKLTSPEDSVLIGRDTAARRDTLR